MRKSHATLITTNAWSRVRPLVACIQLGKGSEKTTSLTYPFVRARQCQLWLARWLIVFCNAATVLTIELEVERLLFELFNYLGILRLFVFREKNNFKTGRNWQWLRNILQYSVLYCVRQKNRMVDNVNEAVRSRMMAGIKGKDTKPEMLVRRWLHADGYRFRVHVRDLPGRPDLVLPKWDAIVQVQGCFWHRHAGCRYATIPATRKDFWTSKLDANLCRDEANHQSLEILGWRLAIIWECSLKHGRAETTLSQLSNWIRNGLVNFETPL